MSKFEQPIRKALLFTHTLIGRTVLLCNTGDDHGIKYAKTPPFWPLLIITLKRKRPEVMEPLFIKVILRVNPLTLCQFYRINGVGEMYFLLETTSRIASK